MELHHQILRHLTCNTLRKYLCVCLYTGLHKSWEPGHQGAYIFHDDTNIFQLYTTIAQPQCNDPQHRC